MVSVRISRDGCARSTRHVPGGPRVRVHRARIASANRREPVGVREGARRQAAGPAPRTRRRLRRSARCRCAPRAWTRDARCREGTRRVRRRGGEERDSRSPRHSVGPPRRGRCWWSAWNSDAASQSASRVANASARGSGSIAVTSSEMPSLAAHAAMRRVMSPPPNPMSSNELGPAGSSAGRMCVR